VKPWVYSSSLQKRANNNKTVYNLDIKTTTPVKSISRASAQGHRIMSGVYISKSLNKI
jgi:hypothetical protein